MATARRTICATCEVEIAGAATYSDEQSFCCVGCAVGGPCVCSYDPEERDGSRVRHCLDVAYAVAGTALADDE